MRFRAHLSIRLESTSGPNNSRPRPHFSQKWRNGPRDHSHPSSRFLHGTIAMRMEHSRESNRWMGAIKHVLQRRRRARRYVHKTLLVVVLSWGWGRLRLIFPPGAMHALRVSCPQRRLHRNHRQKRKKIESSHKSVRSRSSIKSALFHRNTLVSDSKISIKKALTGPRDKKR